MKRPTPSGEIIYRRFFGGSCSLRLVYQPLDDWLILLFIGYTSNDKPIERNSFSAMQINKPLQVD